MTFTFQKSYFLLLHIKFYKKPVTDELMNKLLNKLLPLSYQSTSNITPWLPLYTSQPTPEVYNTTALLTLPYKYT